MRQLEGERGREGRGEREGGERERKRNGTLNFMYNLYLCVGLIRYLKMNDGVSEDRYIKK